ncbi:hypothetical protein MKZ38_006511 [Zalerion maritima]|uniref:Uncharacterized protein n=1 Tax=Zalerion maritima TaxID=339359 RepID=A0AAD5RYP5_9PEZI|nr:hypothetical protein MKZ38_006511 [Zalerion maritima]
MATPAPAFLLTSDSGTQFSPKLEGGVCSLEGMPEEDELTESAIFAANEGRQTATPANSDTPHTNPLQLHHHYSSQQTLSPPPPISVTPDPDEDENAGPPDNAGSLRTRPSSGMAGNAHYHINATGLSDHSDGGVLAAETLTDLSPSPGPPPAPPEYDAPPPPTVRQSTPSQVAIALGINLRENALETPLIPVAVEFEDGLIPVEVVGSITDGEPTTPEPQPETSTSRPESTVGQPSRGPGSGQASPASTIDPWPPLSPATPLGWRQSATSMTLPGEEVLFQGALKVGECKEDGALYIWQNQLSVSRDFRVQWHTGSGKETMWMKPSTAQIVPVYAQAYASPLRVYLRDTNGTQTPAFEFSTPDELFKLQTSLTGERVVLDVSCAKWLRANKPKGDSSAETFTGIRVQIWHEIKKSNLPRRLSSESRISIASTDALSGPRKDWVVPQQSRLVVFLGQTGGLLTLPITDDVEMEDKGEILVKLKARRYSGLRRRRSQSGVRGREFVTDYVFQVLCTSTLRLLTRPQFSSARIVSAADQPGLPFHNTTVDNSQKYESYKNLDIEFETEDTKKEFVSVWSEVVEFRRKQRARIEKIQEEMGKQTFTGKQAIRQWF